MYCALQYTLHGTRTFTWKILIKEEGKSPNQLFQGTRKNRTGSRYRLGYFYKHIRDKNLVRNNTAHMSTHAKVIYCVSVSAVYSP